MLVNIKLQVYAGKKIQLAFVYKNAKTDSAPKWEIQNVKIGVTPGVPGGTEDDPLTCAEVIALNNTAAGPYYVKGYIIGLQVALLVSCSAILQISRILILLLLIQN